MWHKYVLTALQVNCILWCDKGL